MDTYEVWVNLLPGTDDIQFVRAVEAYLGRLCELGKMHSFRVRRRKFGFGPEGLGEFNISMEFDHLAQLEEAFNVVATRDDPIEGLHREVFSVVCNFKSGLYRDFPDPVRVTRDPT